MAYSLYVFKEKLDIVCSFNDHQLADWFSASGVF